MGIFFLSFKYHSIARQFFFSNLILFHLSLIATKSNNEKVFFLAIKWFLITIITFIKVVMTIFKLGRLIKCFFFDKITVSKILLTSFISLHSYY